MIGEGGNSTWGLEDNEMTEELQKEAKVTQPDQKDTAHATGNIPCYHENPMFYLQDLVYVPHNVK